MRCRLVLIVAAALGAYQSTVFMAAPLACGQTTAAALALEFRAFNGSEEVTPQVRVTIHRAGERGEPFKSPKPADGRVEVEVPPGIYDLQAIHEREGRVLSIRWANRLVVMPYPDEQGRHLEVVNFKNGFGALQVRTPSGATPDVAMFEAGGRDKATATPIGGQNYVLFIVPAGRYDLLVRDRGKANWHTGVDVPLDRTRLWITP
jgi:hypothetical protein